MKKITFILITHRIYAHSYENMPQGYQQARTAMWNVARTIVTKLIEKYGNTTLSQKITTDCDGDHDDDVFDYIKLWVPKCELDYVKGVIHNSVADGGRGWLVSEDCSVLKEYEVEYSANKRKLRRGQLLALNNLGMRYVHILGVEQWKYDYGLIKATRRHEEDSYGYRKFFRFNRSGLSTKLLCSLDTSLTAKDFKTKIPTSAVKSTGDFVTHYLCVDINEKNRAALMRIARQHPKCLDLTVVDIADEDKLDFIKTLYRENDKKAKAAEQK